MACYPSSRSTHRGNPIVSDESTTDKPGDESVPELPPPAERSMELPAVIIGERGDEEQRPRVRLLPGRVPKSVVLFPAYAAVGLAGLLATHFSLEYGEWHPAMTLLGWGLLCCWYWVYGVGHSYRRWLMKYFSLLMSTITAGGLIAFSAMRSRSMLVPGDEGMVLRSTVPTLFIVNALTISSLIAVFVHVFYLGRGYRQKQLHDTNEAD